MTNQGTTTVATYEVGTSMRYVGTANALSFFSGPEADQTQANYDRAMAMMAPFVKTRIEETEDAIISLFNAFERFSIGPFAETFAKRSLIFQHTHAQTLIGQRFIPAVTYYCGSDEEANACLATYAIYHDILTIVGWSEDEIGELCQEF